MANVFATKSGNWSDTTVWNTGGLPTSADDVYANNFTVNINVNAQVLSIRTLPAGILKPINAGGSFILNNGVSLSANVLTGTTTCLSFTAPASNSATVVGNIYGSNTTSNIYGLHITNGGTVTVVGSAFGGVNLGSSLFNLYGIYVNGPLNLFGDVFAGQSPGGSCYGLLIDTNVANIVGNVYGSNIQNAGNNCAGIGTQSSTATINLTGNVIPGTNRIGAFSSGLLILGGTVNIVGDVYGPSLVGNATSSGIHMFGINPVSLTITGNLYGGGAIPGGGYPGAAVADLTTSRITINGNVYGGSLGVGLWVYGRVNVNGSIFAGSTFPSSWLGNFPYGAIVNSETAFLSAIRAVANDGGLGSFNVANVPAIANPSQNATVIVRELECGRRGQFPVTGPVYVQPLSSSVCIMKTDAFENVSLITSNSATDLLPSASNVRSGVSYNLGSSTGTLIMPDPATVALGVPTDNSTGTAISPPVSSIWNTDLNTLTATSLSGNMGYRLKDAATAQNMGHLIAAFNG